MRELDAGARIGRFEIVRLLGAGGMGAVYEARDPELARSVALKLIHEPDPRKSLRLMVRLMREAQALAQLQHPNVVAVHEVGSAGADLFVAMELVDGTTVDQVSPGPTTWRAVVAMFVQAGHGLVAAHAKGLVHRDVKPSNLLVDRHGRVRVGDFGLARLASARGTGSVERVVDATAETVDASDESVDGDDLDGTDATPGDGALLDAPLTRPGSVVGTPRYMAPELFKGAPASPATDQYSFCFALRELLPADAPRWLVRVVDQGASGDPSLRHPSMAALVDILERTPARRRGRTIAAVGAAVLVGAVVIGAVVFSRERAPAVRCEATGDGFAAVWTAEQRARAHPSIAAVLDRDASRWRDTRIAACRATQRGEQSPEMLDRRMQCLDRQLGTARTVLAAADTTSVAALDGIAQLPDPDVCSATLLSNALPLPDDPRVAEIERLLDEAFVARIDAERAKGLERIEAGLVLAGELGHPGLRAALLSERAGLLWETDPAGAQKTLEEAHEAAVAAGDANYEVSTTIDLLGLAYARSELQSIEALLPMARAASKRDGIPEGRKFQFQENEANALVFLGRYDEALAACDRLAELEAEPELETTDCRCFALQSADRDSFDACGLAVAAAEATYGADHPRTIFALGRLANAVYEQGRYEEALALNTRVVATTEATYGPASVDVASALQQRMTTLRDLNRFEESRADGERALAIFEQLGLSRAAADVHGGLGQTFTSLGDAERAGYHADEGLRLIEAALGPDHPSLAQSYAIHGVSHAGLGNWERGATSLARCIELATTHLGAAHPLTGQCILGYAEVVLNLGRYREALATVERVFATADVTTFRKDNQAAIHGIHGRALRGLGKKKQARAAFERALAAYRELGDQQRVETVEGWLRDAR